MRRMRRGEARALRRAAVLLVASALGAGAGGPARAFELGDLFRTPGERAARALESDARRRLVDEHPGSEWAAHARYRDGEADAALAGFEALLAAEDDPDERHRLGYNRATALVRAGRAAEAVRAFDALLEARPDDAEAVVNREIARRLVELGREREPAPERGPSARERRGAETASGERAAGEHTVALEGDLAPGVYVVRLEVDGAVASRRFVVAR